jgi:hypothetical protein
VLCDALQFAWREDSTATVLGSVREDASAWRRDRSGEELDGMVEPPF